MTEKDTEQLIELIFGEIEVTVDNGSDGVDNDLFTTWESAEAAELYA